MDLKKAAIIYGISDYSANQWTDAKIAFAAQFDFLVCDWTINPLVVQMIKALNPDMKILLYWNFFCDSASADFATATLNESWFTHDLAGNRVTYLNFPTEYLMAPSSGWQQYSSATINAKLASIPLADGVLIDNVWGGFRAESLSSNQFDTSVVVNWVSMMSEYVAELKGNAAGKIVIVNTDEYLTDLYLNICDGKQFEAFAHYRWSDMNTFYGPQQEIDDAYRADGKIYIATSGAQGSLSTAQIKQLQDYCVAAALMGMNGDSLGLNFCLPNGGNPYSVASQSNFPVFPLTGNPKGPYYMNQGIFMRDFDSKKVLLNYGTARTATLDGTYTNEQGVQVDSVSMAANTALFLTPQEAPPSSYTLTVSENPAASGTFSVFPSLPTYPAGTQVQITATAAPNFKFLNFSVNGGSPDSTNPIVVTMDSNKGVIGFFSESAPPKPSIAARIPSLGNKALVQVYLRKLRDKVFSKKLHERLHPLI